MKRNRTQWGAVAMEPQELRGPVSEPLPCWKRSFASERAAREAPSERRMRAYRCPQCGLWHRTEKLREWR